MDEIRRLMDLALGDFDRGFICIDALDECSEEHKSKFLRWVAEVVKDLKGRVRLFITGRPNMKSLVDKFLPSLHTAMTLEASDNDIRAFVFNELEMDVDYDEMDDGFKKEIVDAIVRTAEGMYV
jgi:hypothetical protein